MKKTARIRQWRFQRGFNAWVIAFIIGAAAPLLLYFLYATCPEARPWIDLGQGGPNESVYGPEGAIKRPAFGFPLAGASVSMLLSALLAYWGVGVALSVRRGPPSDNEERTAPLHLTPAISILFFTIPLLSAAWSLNIKADRFPDLQWEVLVKTAGMAEPLYLFRRVLDLALLFPQLSAALCVMSLVIDPSREAAILCVISIAVFVFMGLFINFIGG